MSLIKIFLVLIFILFPLGQLERLPLANPQIGLYGHDLVIMLVLGIWFWGKIKLGKFGKLVKLEKAILVFWLMALISFLLNVPSGKPRETIIALLYLLRWVAYAGLYFVVKEQKFKGLMFKGLIGAGVAAAILGLLQYFFYPDIRPLTVYGWDPHYYRVVGTYLEPGFAGLIFVLTIILIITRNWANWSNWAYWALLALCYSAFALTYSRSSYLAYLAGMGLIAYFKKSVKFFLVILGIFIFTLLVLPRPGGEGVKLERQASILSRFQSWQQGFSVFEKKPIFGVGFNFYRSAAGNAAFSHAGAGADNSFIFVLATTGIIGLFFYMRLFLKIIKNKAVSLPILASLMVLIVHSLFNNSLFYPWAMIWFWFLLASYGA